MKSRKVYYLINITRRFASLGVPRERLKAVGWTKLQLIAKELTKANAEKLLTLAETSTTRELREWLRGREPDPDAHCVIMYQSRDQYRVFEEAVFSNPGEVSLLMECPGHPDGTPSETCPIDLKSRTSSPPYVRQI